LEQQEYKAVIDSLFSQKFTQRDQTIKAIRKTSHDQAEPKIYLNYQVDLVDSNGTCLTHDIVVAAHYSDVNKLPALDVDYMSELIGKNNTTRLCQ